MRDIPEPESQIQEVLYELIKRLFIDRRTMMLSSGVWNLTARISNLRDLGIAITSNEVTSTNKYKREITFVKYSLDNKLEAIEAYMKLKKNQMGISIDKKQAAN